MAGKIKGVCPYCGSEDIVPLTTYWHCHSCEKQFGCPRFDPIEEEKQESVRVGSPDVLEGMASKKMLCPNCGRGFIGKDSKCGTCNFEMPEVWT